MASGPDNMSKRQVALALREEGSESRMLSDDWLSLVELLRGGLFKLPQYVPLLVIRGNVIAKDGHTNEEPVIHTIAVGTAVLRLAAATDVRAAIPSND